MADPAVSRVANPLVSVIIPVHDTLPYLDACLTSLVDQTINDIGPEALEVLAIDDGSTDGSAEMLDDYAARHDIFHVEHHPASGGPATPRNRALDLARGRYVFFLDSDDYLWTEALLRLYEAAEEWDSDVVLGRMVGEGGRGVSQRIYRSTRQQIDLTDPDLPYTLSVTKLFRRSFVEDHGLRFDPALRIGSDQPYAVAAMLNAGRISVLADHVYYHLVMREDRSNITYSVPWRPQLHDLSEMIHQVSALLPAGELRDNVLSRHFNWELTGLLTRAWEGLDQSEKAVLVAGVAQLSEAYLVPGMTQRLFPRSRVVQGLVRKQRIDLLDALFADERRDIKPGLVLRNDRVFRAWPGFGELPEEWYDVTDRFRVGWLRETVHTDELVWEGPVLKVAGRLRFRAEGDLSFRAVLVPVDHIQLRASGAVWSEPGDPTVSAQMSVEPVLPEPARSAPPSSGQDGYGARFTAELDANDLLRAQDGPHRRWELRLRFDIAGHSYDLAVVEAPGARTRARLGGRFFRLVARNSPRARLVVFRQRLPLRQALAEKFSG